MYVRGGGITDDGGGGGVNSVWQSEASQRQLPSCSANLRAQARAAGKSEGASQG